MLNFLRDPAWQGIGVIISLVLGFIGFYYAGRNRLWLYLSGVIVIFIIGFGLGIQLQMKAPISPSELPLIPVDSTKDWQPTGFNVKKGNTIIIRVEGGGWTLGRRKVDLKKYPAIDKEYISTPNIGELWHQFPENQGEGYDYLKCLKLECPKVKEKLGSLIGKIANPDNYKLDEVFEVGQEISYISPIDGFLLLRMNDTQIGDNGGILLTRIEVKD